VISFDFEYYKPLSVGEALQLYRELHAQNKRTLYLAGGTEFIGMARLGQTAADAVIDLKGIPECNVLESREGNITIGATVSLSQLGVTTVFPLLSQHSKGIADHTSRNRITIGGNIAGKTVYREIVLPLLLCDSQVVIAREGGVAIVPLQDVFHQHLHLEPGEFVVQIRIQESDAKLPFVSLKKTRLSKTDYPLVSLAAIFKDNQIRFALSGVCGYPFRSKQMEMELSDSAQPVETRAEHALNYLPDPIVSDFHGSSEYRRFVLRNALCEAIRLLEGGTG